MVEPNSLTKYRLTSPQRDTPGSPSKSRNKAPTKIDDGRGSGRAVTNQEMNPSSCSIAGFLLPHREVNPREGRHF